MIITCEEMLAWEAEAFNSGVEAESLMDEAGKGIAEAIQQFFPKPAHIVLYLGKGNNAGDALVAARFLHQAGWKIYSRRAFAIEDFKPLPTKHWRELSSFISDQPSSEPLHLQRGPLVLLDGLLGIGAKGTLRGTVAALAGEMNTLRQTRHDSVIALDIPSGLDPDSGIPGTDAVVADITLTIAQVKKPLVEDSAVNHVGRLAIIPLTGLPPRAHEVTRDSRVLLTSDRLIASLPRRTFDYHKGQAGRVGIIAGSRGFLGAAELCARGALLGGAGLITLYVKPDFYDLAASRMPAEVMVKSVEDYTICLDDRLDALAIGPGLGDLYAAEMIKLMSSAKCPMLVDADGLNILSQAGMKGLALLESSSQPMLLTPHPGEMKRLAEGFSLPLAGLSRSEQVISFINHFPKHTLLLKGARTVIGSRDMPLAFNSTGHPGMASGGMGDTLSGVVASLLAQGLDTHTAACLGAWLCGRAAELAVTVDGNGLLQSIESTTASSVLDHFGAAFTSLRTLGF